VVHAQPTRFVVLRLFEPRHSSAPRITSQRRNVNHPRDHPQGPLAGRHPKGSYTGQYWICSPCSAIPTVRRCSKFVLYTSLLKHQSRPLKPPDPPPRSTHTPAHSSLSLHTLLVFILSTIHLGARSRPSPILQAHPEHHQTRRAPREHPLAHRALLLRRRVQRRRERVPVREGRAFGGDHARG
jgi:hypothetical protein